MDINELDVLIVGGGAAGASLAFNLCMKSKLKIALIDRAKRDLIGKKPVEIFFLGIGIPIILSRPEKMKFIQYGKISI